MPASDGLQLVAPPYPKVGQERVCLLIAQARFGEKKMHKHKHGKCGGYKLLLPLPSPLPTKKCRDGEGEVRARRERESLLRAMCLLVEAAFTSLVRSPTSRAFSLPIFASCTQFASVTITYILYHIKVCVSV